MTRTTVVNAISLGIAALMVLAPIGGWCASAGASDSDANSLARINSWNDQLLKTSTPVLVSRKDYDENVDDANPASFRTWIIVPNGGYDYLIPTYWFWHYDASFFSFLDSQNRGPRTWQFFEEDHPNWTLAAGTDPNSDGCASNHSPHRRIQINFPRKGDYVCVPVPTNPAIWVRNPNPWDPYMTMVAVAKCPQGLFATTTHSQKDWPTPGDMTCSLPPQPCRSFKIVFESGMKIDKVILTTNDFEILKQNDHVFTVLPAKPDVIMAVPTMGIHELNLLIKQHSDTAVPDVPANDF